jgi:hypothetical protein
MRISLGGYGMTAAERLAHYEDLVGQLYTHPRPAIAQIPQ